MLMILRRTLFTTQYIHAKPVLKAIARKEPRVCNPDFTRCRGAAVLEGEEDPLLGPDEAYPSWLWALADRPKTIDEHLKKPDQDLFRKMRTVRLMMHKRIQKLRHKFPELSQELKFPTDEEVIERIREYERQRSQHEDNKQDFVDSIREKAASEIAARKGGVEPGRNLK